VARVRHTPSSSRHATSRSQNRRAAISHACRTAAPAHQAPRCGDWPGLSQRRSRSGTRAGPRVSRPGGSYQDPGRNQRPPPSLSRQVSRAYCARLRRLGLDFSTESRHIGVVTLVIHDLAILLGVEESRTLFATWDGTDLERVPPSIRRRPARSHPACRSP
jgi:hypothetical protein